MSVVDQVKSRLDIVDVISGYVPLKKAGRNFKAPCPFHSEKTPSFTVFPDTQTWRCFGQCGEGGDIFSFVMKREGWDFSEALRELARRAGVELDTPEPGQKRDADAHLYSLLHETAQFFHETLANSPAEQYIRRRGLTPETAEQFTLGYAPDDWQAALHHLTALGFAEADVIEAGVAIRSDKGRVYDRFRHRFVIPIRDGRGRTIGFGARALRDEDQPKYLNSPQSPLFDKSHVLFGFDLARRAIRERETAVIVEGYMDVIQAHQAGFYNVVATMGTALTEHHIQQLSKYAEKLVLALDADAAGIKATMRGLDVAREALGGDDTVVVDPKGMMKQAGRLKVDIRVLELPHGKDPDDFIRSSPDEWEPQVDAALPLAEYIIKVATADLPDNASVAERESLAVELLPLLMATEDNLQQRTNIQLLSLRLRLDEKAMLNWANQYIREQTPTSQKRGPSRQKKSTSAKQTKAAPAASQKTMTMRGRELEQYCLSVMLREPQRLFEADRLLRQMSDAGGNNNGLPLQTEDFTQSAFQAIFNLLQEACHQDEQEPLDYLLDHADSLMRQTIDDILPEPLEVYARKVAQVWRTELASVQRAKSLLPTQQRDEFPRRVLALRRERLQREGQEFYFMIAEAQKSSDTLLQQTCTLRFSEIGRTLRILDAAIIS